VAIPCVGGPKDGYEEEFGLRQHDLYFSMPLPLSSVALFAEPSLTPTFPRWAVAHYRLDSARPDGGGRLFYRFVGFEEQ
jgi:hypothetical protein